MDEIDGRGRPFFGGYGHGRNELMHGMYGRGRREEGKDNNDQAKNLDDVICSRWKEIDDEQTYDDVISSLTTQLTSDERILEALL